MNTAGETAASRETMSTKAHRFLGERHDIHARCTMWVLVLCATTMVVEIVAGLLFGSMALLADNLHMVTHAGVMLVAAAAYHIARKRQDDPTFSLGTGKIGDLAAFASALALASTAVFMAIESVKRLVYPVPIALDEAIPVACAALVVNLISIWLLHDGLGILAIVGLIAARQLGWVWLDPLLGLLAAAVILHWAVALLRAASSVLLDRVPDQPLAKAVRKRLEREGATVTDFRIWQLGPGHHAVIATLARAGFSADHYHRQLAAFPTLSHVTIEIARKEATG